MRLATRLRVLLLVVVLAVPALGATPQAPAPGTFDAAFVQQRFLPGLAQPIVNRGRIHVGADGSLRWEVTEPYHYVFAMRGQDAFEILPDGTRRAVDAAGKPWLAVVRQVFAGLLRGDTAELSRYFEVARKPGADGLEQITLKPRAHALADSIDRIEVLADAGNRAHAIDILERSGARVRITFQFDHGH